MQSSPPVGVSGSAKDSTAGSRKGGTSRANLVITYLRDHIRDGGLGPGARLPSETSISAELGVSRPVVREAMRSLAATGLIEMGVGRVATVSALSSDALREMLQNAVLIGQVDVSHIMEMRRGIEIDMARLAAEHCTADIAAELETVVADMTRSISDVGAYIALDLRLHLLLAKATGNPIYGMVLDAFRQLLQASMTAGMESWAASSNLSQVPKIHADLVAAVTAGDPTAAQAAMRRHFDSAIEVMLDARRPGARRAKP